MTTNEIQSTDNHLKLPLAPTLCIETVAELYEQLRPAVDANQPVSLDASIIESIDTANLQLLAAFAVELDKRGTTLLWEEPSEIFLQAAAISGLVATLKLPDAA